MAPHTILFMAADPVGARMLGQQAREIQAELQRATGRDCFKLETRWAVQPLDLLREIRRQTPTVVHFCGGRIGGRGASAAGLYFQAEDGHAQLVPAQAMAKAFDVVGSSVKLVVLDACYSELHATAIAAHIDCVIGFAGETIDRAGTSFAIGLYGGLGAGESVEAAFEQGCAAIGLTGADQPQPRPRLLVRPGVDPSRVFLTDPGETAHRARRDKLADDTGTGAPLLVAVGQSPALGTHAFIGRERELVEIETLLTGATDVQLHAALDGLPGIGKTELARQVVARLAQAKKFPGGIFWFNAERADLRLQWAELVEGPDRALPDLDARATWAVRQVVQRAQDGDAVLIVLDNVETWKPPPSPLPDVAAIRMLVTTRARWLHNSFRPYEVPPLKQEPARTLLRVIIGHEVEGTDELLAALGGHVLSIELAATYLREYGTPPAEYLLQLAAGKSPDSSVADQTSYRATANSAFGLLWKRIAPEVQQAWVLAAQLPPAWFSIELAEAIGLDVERRRALVRLHLLDRNNQARHQMHRLLREFALAEAPPSPSVKESVKTYGEHHPAVATDRNDLASVLRDLGELPAALQLFEQALASNLLTYGEHHPAVARGRNNITWVLQDLGELPGRNPARMLQDPGQLPVARQLWRRITRRAIPFGRRISQEPCSDTQSRP